MVDALDKRVDQRFIDADKRHDERFVAQRDYNVVHNSLQRAMTDQAEKMLSRVEFAEKHDSLKERISRLERWPWLAIGIFSLVQIGVVIWIGLRK